MQGQTVAVDAIFLEVMRCALYSVADEMIAALVRTAYSTNIKDRRDCSAAVYTPAGVVVAQGGVGTPLHLGVMSSVVRTVLERVPLSRWEPGDDIMVNIPYPAGPGHLNDVTVVSPVFCGGEIIALVANMSHHIDVGGFAPGSMPVNVHEIFQEGLQIPPVKIVKRDRVDEELLAFFLANIRTRRQGRGDLMAQIAANNVGEQRMQEVAERHGADMLSAAMKAILDYSERRMRAGIRELPNGTYTFTDYIEMNDAEESLLPIQVAVTIGDEDIVMDFAGSATQVRASLNCRLPSVQAAAYYVIKCLVDPGLPPNDGVYRPVRVLVEEGSLLHARYPASTVNSNIVTSPRIADAIMGALLKAVPERLGAASSGTMNMVIIGGIDPRTDQAFSYTETYGGGQGAFPNQDGMSGVHTHMTNTRNAPVEIIEATYPITVERYGLVMDSEGAGQFRGGLGMERRVLVHTDGTLTVSSDRHRLPPWGVAGGQPASKSRFQLIHPDGECIELPGKVTRDIQAGDRFVTITPGGGGWGEPTKRAPDDVEQDVKERIVSKPRAGEVYGWVGDEKPEHRE